LALFRSWRNAINPGLVEEFHIFEMKRLSRGKKHVSLWVQAPADMKTKFKFILNGCFLLLLGGVYISLRAVN